MGNNGTQNAPQMQKYPDPREGVSLREYMDMRLNAAEQAVALARAQMEDRLEGMNEFREQLREQTATYMSRGEIDLLLDRLGDRIRNLESSRDLLAGKASQSSVYIAYVMAAIGLALSVYSTLVK